MEFILSQEMKEINRLYKELAEIYHEIALKIGISDSIFVIYYAIAELGTGCLQKDIADRYFISKQTINSSIKKLSEQNYITLKNGKGHNRHIMLTALGEKFINEKIIPVIELENSIFAEMGEKESKEILRLNQKFVSLYRKNMKKLK